MFYQHEHFGASDYFKIEKNCNFKFPAHLHQCFEFIVIRSGEMQVTVDGKKYRVKENEGMMIFPNQIHSLDSEKSEHALCIFAPQLIQCYAARVAGKVPLNNKFIPDPYFANALDYGEYTLEAKKGILYSLCSQFDKTAEYLNKQSDKSDLLSQIFRFVEANFSGDCSLTTLSDTVRYNSSYVSRYFKKTIGISYIQYVDLFRLSQASHLIMNSALPLIQCAQECGYTSVRSFNRNFKRHFSMSPTAYRNNRIRVD